MPATFSTPKKVSKRGILGDGRPSKQTPAKVRKICSALAMGLNDEEAALVAGISDVTMTLWRRDPAFVERIKRAVALRLYKRLQRIEAGVEGWQGTGWCLERQFPTRFSKPEVQISLNNSFNQTVNALSITISPEEIKTIESQAGPVREKVKELYATYQRTRVGEGNGAEEQGAAAAVSEEVQKKFANYRPGNADATQ
jgi:hypothetical protein